METLFTPIFSLQVLKGGFIVVLKIFIYSIHMPRKSRRLGRKSKRNFKKSRRTQSKKTMMDGGASREELIIEKILLFYKNGKITQDVLERVAHPYVVHVSGKYFTGEDGSTNHNKEAFDKIKEKWEAYKKTLERKHWLFGTTTYSKKLYEYYYDEFNFGTTKTRMISWLEQGAPGTVSPTIADTYSSV